jgi:hypothetical protein
LTSAGSNGVNNAVFASGGTGITFLNYSFGGGGYGASVVSVSFAPVSGRNGGGGPIQNGVAGTGGGGGGGYVGPNAFFPPGNGGSGFVLLIVPFTSYTTASLGAIAVSNNALTITGYSNSFSRQPNVVFEGNVLPGTATAYTLGSIGKQWLGVYASNMYVSKTSFFTTDDLGNVILHQTAPNRTLNIIDICDSATSVIPGTMQSQTCIVAVGGPGATGRSPIQFSTDGTSWTDLSVPGLTSAYDVAYDGNNNWVAIGAEGAFTGNTGNSWTKCIGYEGLMNGGYPFAALCYAYSNTTWYSVGSDPCGFHTIVKSQYNPNSWQYAIDATSPARFEYSSVNGFDNTGGVTIASDGGTMIVVGGYSSDVSDIDGDPLYGAIQYASTHADGQWCNAVSSDSGKPIDGACTCLAYNGEYWLAAANSNVLLSRDGVHWKTTGYSTLGNTQSLEWNGQYWLLAHSAGYVMKSYDGYVWTVLQPLLNKYLYCLGWNGLRWVAGGTTFEENDSTIYSLKPTDTEWRDSTDNLDSSVSNVLLQVNNFANRTLLPNAPLIPGTSTINGTVPGIAYPPITAGNVGDYYRSPGGSNVPANTWGPKIEEVNYGLGGSMNFLASQYDFASPITSTSEGSANYNIGTGSFAINWWMYAPVTLSGLSNSPPTGTIISMLGDTSPENGQFSVNIEPDQQLYFSAMNGDTQIPLNATVGQGVWQYCSLTRDGSVGTFGIGSVFGTSVTNTYTDATGFSNAYVGNSTSPVQIGYTFVGVPPLNGLLLTNIRVIAGVPSLPGDINVVPSAPLSNVSGTQLLFNLTNPSGWIDSASNTPMNVDLSQTVWSGLNPFYTMNLSWGAPLNRMPFTFTGYGVPTSDPSGSIPDIGDIYIDLSDNSKLYNITS